MNKKLLIVLSSIALALLLAVNIFAADAKTVYVADGGTGTGETSESPLGSLSDAVSALNGEGGNIVICGDLTQSAVITIAEQSADLNITAENGGNLTLGANILLEKNTNDNIVTFDFPLNVTTAAAMYGGFNSIVFGTGFTVDGTFDFYGGAAATNAGVYTTLEWDTYWAENAKCVTDLPYSITVNGGTFNTFMGGNYRAKETSLIGSIAGTLDITINGGTFGSGVSFDADDALKLDKAFSISGMSIIAGDASLTITDGTFNTPIYIQGYIGQTSTYASNNSQVTNSDAKYYAADGDIKIDISGGTLNGCEISAFQNSASYNLLLRGNVDITVSKNAVLADGMVIDATQVKPYADGTEKATLTYPADKNVKYVRFDTVNGEPKEYNEPTRIACIGDSITQGTGAKVNSANAYETHAYPAQLLSKAIAADKDVIISNYGCGATKVLDYSGLWYNDTLAYTLSQNETDADYYIIGLGTNDASTCGRATGQALHFYNGYKALIESYEKLSDTKMVFGTSAIYRLSSSNGSNLGAVSIIRPMQEKVLTELAADNKKVTYIDLYALTLDEALAGTMLGSDRLHPHADGYTIYAENIYNAIFNNVCTVENFELTDIYISASGTNNAECTSLNPTSNIEIAFAKAAPNATIHVMGDFSFSRLGNAYYAFNTPFGVENLTIAGDSEGSSLTVDGKLFYVNSNIKFDNILLKTSASGSIYIALNYHSAEFTDTFTTAGTDKAILIGGVLTFADDPSSALYNSVESVSSDNDCTITVNGGSYLFLNGGNYHWPGNTGAIYGTYGGDMVLNIGKNVVMADNDYTVYDGANGMNYLTGSITMNVDYWPDGVLVRDYTKIGTSSVHKASYNEGRNTGTVIINLADSVNAKVLHTLDFTGDGDFTISDIIKMIHLYLDGYDASTSINFYDKTEISLVNVHRAFKVLINQ